MLGSFYAHGNGTRMLGGRRPSKSGAWRNTQHCQRVGSALRHLLQLLDEQDWDAVVGRRRVLVHLVHMGHARIAILLMNHPWMGSRYCMAGSRDAQRALWSNYEGVFLRLHRPY